MKTNSENINSEEKILLAAEEIFLRDGYSGSRMQDIADLAGINKALLHYYFRSKDKLFEYVFDQKTSVMFPQMEELFEKDLSFQELISEFIKRYITLLSANPFLPLFVINTINKPDRQDFMNKLPIHINQKILEVFQRDLALEKVKSINPMQFMISIFGMCAFPFMAKPMIMKMTNANEAEFKKLMQNRIIEVQNYVKMILEP